MSTFSGVNEETGAVLGIAIDSAMSTPPPCQTTTTVSSSIILKTHKGLSVPLPGAGGQLQDGASVAADPLNHLFLVTQPLSSVSPSGGSTIFVYDENVTLVETINGFELSNVGAAVFESVHVNARQRTGYVNGPGANELQEFTY